MRTWITPEVIALKREAIESIYHHRMTVYRNENVYNPETGFDEQQWVPYIIDEPCRASTQLVEPTEGRPEEHNKKLRLHCAPELVIEPGSRIDITFYHDVHQSFRHVSSSRNYSDHQVILMRRFDKEDENYN